MNHESRASFRGEMARAFEFAAGVLTSVGFRIDERGEDYISMRGPGLNSSRESPLRGTTAVRIRRSVGELILDAELGGVRSMDRFLFWFPTLLCLFIGLVNAVVFSLVKGPGPWIWSVVAAVAANGLLWSFLAPWISKHVERRTRDSLDALLANTAAMG
jgi:hypothetical protein